MSKTKLFLENFFIYGVGGVISKIVPLLIVPVITRLFPDTIYFGLYDMQGSMVQFTSAIAILGMGDAMYRMFFEKDDLDYKKTVCSTTLTFTIIFSFFISVLLVVLRKPLGLLFFNSTDYDILVYYTAITIFIGATNGIIAAPTRMQNKRKTYILLNTLTPIICYSISILLLLRGYYLIAMPLSYAIAVLIIELSFYVLNRSWFKLSYFDFSVLKQLLPIAIPLLPNFAIFWLFDVCNKVMITNALGVAESGVYAIASKFGHLSQLICLAFSGGWQFFAFSTMHEKDQVKSNSLIFEYLGIVCFIATMFMCALSFFLHHTLFFGDYINAYIVAPYLFVTPLFLILFQTASNQFVIIKKTWPNLVILGFTVVLNLVLDYFLIPVFGIEGAGFASVISYLLAVIICALVCWKMQLMILSFKFFACIGLMAGFFVVWRLYLSKCTIPSCLFALAVSVLMLLIYKKDVMMFVNKIKEIVLKKLGKI